MCYIFINQATERIAEIDNYRDGLEKRLEEVKGFASKVQTVCTDERWFVFFMNS